MRNENQVLIEKVLAQLAKSRKAEAADRRRARIAQEQATAAMTLLMDDLTAEGVDLNSPQGMHILALVLAAKASTASGYRSSLNEHFEGGI